MRFPLTMLPAVPIFLRGTRDSARARTTLSAGRRRAVGAGAPPAAQRASSADRRSRSR